MKVALLMGSFNPIHIGHVAVARYVLDKGIAHQVWCVVSPENPLKGYCEVEFGDRLEMAQRAFEGIEGVVVCDIENELSKPSYTFNTITELRKRFPENEFFILCGSDIAGQFDRWYRIEELKKEVEFLVYPRGAGECSAEFKGALLIDVSSTILRTKIDKSLLPKGVYNYILEKSLYIDGWDEQIMYDKGMDEYGKGNFGASLNWFNKSSGLNNNFLQAKEMVAIVCEILAFRHTDIYNP